METVPLELPADLVRVAKLDKGDLSRETAKLLALELFREDKVSLGRAAELCQTPLAAFMEYAAQHDVSPLRYGERELEEDRQALAELGL
jgi:predicted HTH domain antitoxin